MATREEPITTTVSTKGQVILPKAVRQRKNWQAGTRLVVEDTPDGVLLKGTPIFPPTRPEEVFGSLAYAGRPKTLEDMEEGIAAEARRRHACDRY
jgi:AbrB family looped-hinge helix DNA binding protein